MKSIIRKKNKFMLRNDKYLHYSCFVPKQQFQTVSAGNTNTSRIKTERRITYTDNIHA